MLEQSPATDRVFHALADGTRRHLIERLSRGPAAVSELAHPLPVSLAAVVQHLQVLEQCGVVTTQKTGRVRTCQLDPRGLLQAERWIAQRRLLWQSRLDRLDALLATPVAAEAKPARLTPGAAVPAPARATKTRPTRRKPC